MGITPTRRAFLSMGVAATAGCETMNPSKSRKNVTRKQVLRIGGEPATEAEVRVIDAPKQGRQQTFPVDANGWVELPTNSLEGTLLVAAEQRQGENEWIAVRPDFHGVEPFESNQQITLNQELIFGPTHDDINTAVSFWRWIDPNNINRQTLYTELIDVRTRVGTDPWELDKLEVDMGAPEKVIFSLTIPEQVFVGYTEQDLDEQVHVVELRDEDTVIQWHSLRDPVIPTRTVTYSDQEYEVFTKSDRNQRQRFREGRSRLADHIFDTFLGAVPIPGTGALGLVNGFFGSMIEQEIEDSGTIGDSFANPDSFERPSRNSHDLITRGYFSRSVHSPAVCFGVPVQFESDGPDSVSFIAEVEWEADAGSFRFGKQFEVKTASESGNVGRSKVDGTWPMYQYNEGNTGYIQNSTGPAEDARQLWTIDTETVLLPPPSVANNTVFSGGSKLFAIDAVSGEEKWTQDYLVWSTPAVIDDIVCVVDRDGHLHAFDTDNGEELWTMETSTSSAVTSSPLAEDDIVYFDNDVNLFAIDANSGKELWRFDKANVGSTPAKFDETIFICGRDPMRRDGVVFAIDGESGTEQWRFQGTGQMIGATPTATEEMIYTGTVTTNEFYAIDTTSGSEAWKFTLSEENFVGTGTPASVAEDLVFVPTFNGTLFALDRHTGTEKWRYTADTKLFPVVVADDIVFLSDREGIVGLNVTDGTIEWSFESKGLRASGFAIVDGTLFAGTNAIGLE